MKEFFNKIKGELRHVVWPTKKLTMMYTILVIIVSIIIAYYLGILDWLFEQGLEAIIQY